MRRLITLVAVTLFAVASMLLPPVPAYGADEQNNSAGTGDPILGDVLDEGWSTSSSKASHPGTGLTTTATWTPAITTGAATAAFIDEARGTTYQASRSASPARIFSNSIADGQALGATELPDTTGSWDMVVSDDLLVVGTNGNGLKRPRLVVRRLDADGGQGELLWDKSLPSTSATSAYVMSVVADAIEPELFWVGTYDLNGARLYSFDATTGQFEEYTPGSTWSDRQLRYVRSLVATEDGVYVGMGNPGSIWRLAPNASRPVELGDALEGAVVSTVYSLAATSTAESTGVEAGGASPIMESDVDDEVVSLHVDGGAAVPSPQQGELQSGEDDWTSAQSGQEKEEPQTPTDEFGESAVSPRDVSASERWVAAGLDSPAGVVILSPSGDRVSTHYLGRDDTAVDRMVVDDDNVLWFTVRPSAALYSLDLTDPKASVLLRSETVQGAETRAISAGDGVIRGVTGMRQLWTFDVSGNEIQRVFLDRGDTPETAETMAQGILLDHDYTLVGGHWRYQAHSAADSVTIDIPGEPKSQIRVGDTVYSALYPHASIFAIDAEQQIGTFVARAEGQTRPRELTYNRETGRLYMGTSNPYGQYGGAISVVDPLTGAIETYDTPVQGQMPYSLGTIGSDLLVGTSPAGEAASAPAGSRSRVARWNPLSPQTPEWTTALRSSSAVTGVTAIEDDAGSFVFAVTLDGYAYAFDGQTGTVLWQRNLPGTTRRLRALDGYVLVQTAGDVIEYFPTRTELTQGLTLASNVLWFDFNHGTYGNLDVATISTASASASRGYITNPRRVDRDAGSNRYATAVAISQSTFAVSNYAVLATGTDFPDALTAGPLAAIREAPVLLNSGPTVLPEVSDELNRLGVKTVYIAGGPGVVPASVEVSLRSRGYKVVRLYGSDRYQTSIAIAEEIRKISGKSTVPMVLTTGTMFPDALSATPAAAQMRGAIILTTNDTMTPQTESYVKGRASSVATVGGWGMNAAKKIGVPTVWNAVGRDRFATSALVAEHSFPNAQRAYVATGNDYPDGLAAGPAAATSSSPVVLSTSDSLPEQAMPILKKTDHVTLVGGQGVLQARLVQQVRSLK